MRTAFNDFFYEKRGIYGVLHVMILLLSLFLIVDISIDTFNNIPFISQTSYLKTCGYFDRHVQQHTVHLSDFVSENAVLDLHVLHRRFHIGVFPVKR